MGHQVTVTCDCCGAELRDAGLVSASSASHLQPDGTVVQWLYGKDCGCANELMIALDMIKHTKAKK